MPIQQPVQAQKLSDQFTNQPASLLDRFNKALTGVTLDNIRKLTNRKKPVTQNAPQQVHTQLARQGKLQTVKSPIPIAPGNVVVNAGNPRKLGLSRLPMMKILLILTIILVLGFLVYFGLQFAKKDGNGETSFELTPTPSSVPVQSEKPSIYSNDEVILKLEEEVKVLDAELNTARINDSKLSLPKLDFNIIFDDK